MSEKNGRGVYPVRVRVKIKSEKLLRYDATHFSLFTFICFRGDYFFNNLACSMYLSISIA